MLTLIAGSVALCPELPGLGDPVWRRDLRGALLGWGIATVVLDVPDAEEELDDRNARAHWVAHCSIGLAASVQAAPVLLVMAGNSCAAAAALGFSQRAARRGVAGYVLVDPILPEVRQGIDWPDAPVTVVVTPTGDEETARAALLRGWEVVRADAVDAVLAIAKA